MDYRLALITAPDLMKNFSCLPHRMNLRQVDGEDRVRYDDSTRTLCRLPCSGTDGNAAKIRQAFL